MAHITHARARRRHERTHGPLFAPFVVFVALAGLAVAYVGYVLWPRWPGAPVSLAAPALPIVVGGTMFNIEPAAIRRAVQRKPGTQSRIDLAYLWPSLVPAELPGQVQTGKAETVKPADPNERLFLTIADGRDAMAPDERMKTIYPRYLGQAVAIPAGGLSLRAFRDGTPYQGEDLIAADGAPDGFTARCSRSGIGNSGMCLLQRRIGGADVTARFPRDWLTDWKAVLSGIDRVLGKLHPG
jgi:hypothetical protein